MARSPGADREGVPRELPQGPPRDLHPTSDIRFVIVEVAKLTERLDSLNSSISRSAESNKTNIDSIKSDLKERLGDLKADGKETKDKVVEIEKSVAFVKGAMWVIGGIFAIALVVIGVALKFLLG